MCVKSIYGYWNVGINNILYFKLLNSLQIMNQYSNITTDIQQTIGNQIENLKNEYNRYFSEWK